MNQNQNTWNLDYEIKNIILKIKDYKRSTNQNLNTPTFQKLLSQILLNKLDSLDEKLINILKIEEKDDSMQIAILNSFIKIFKSLIYFMKTY